MCAMFAPATRRKLKLRMAICSPAGYGKSATGLVFAQALAEIFNTRIAAIDTEHGALSKYTGVFAKEFVVCELQHFAPSAYTAAIREAAAGGFGVLLIDSLSHAWSGVGGALAQVDAKAGSGGNSYTAWKDVTPQHNELVEAILAYPGHVIATMRTKMEYVLEEDTNKAGKKVMVPKKVGMKPVQREGMDYEFDVVADMDESHTLIISKTRCPAIDGQRVVKPGPEFLAPVIRWLDEGTDAPAHAPAFVPSIPSVTAATSAGLVLATDLQVSEIQIACQTLQLAGQPAAMLAKRGVDRLEKLSKQQADEILGTLRAKLQARKVDLDKQLAAAEKSSPKGNVGRATGPEQSGSVTDNGPAAIASTSPSEAEQLTEPEQAFVKAMKACDWYYDYSDDPRAFERGRSSRNKVDSLAMTIPEARRVELWGWHAPRREGVLQFACPGVTAPKPDPTKSTPTAPICPLWSLPKRSPAPRISKSWLAM